MLRRMCHTLFTKYNMVVVRIQYRTMRQSVIINSLYWSPHSVRLEALVRIDEGAHLAFWDSEPDSDFDDDDVLI